MTCQTTRGPGRTNLGKDLTPAQGAPQQGTTESNENRPGRTTTREAHQGDRHTSENRSRSPVNKEKDPVIILGSQEPPSDAPPNNPDAAMTKGWKNEDFGGVGDGLFRAVGAYLEYAEGAKSVNNKKATTRGALLRKDSVHYIRRHTDRFKNYFHTKADGTGPQTFEAWLSECGKQETFANGVLLQALAEILGSVLVVWTYKNETWERYCIATRFGSNQLACKAKTGHHIALLLKNAHYTLVRGPSKDTFPTFWIKECPEVWRHLEGGVSNTKVSGKNQEVIPVSPGTALSIHSGSSGLRGSGRATPSVHSAISSRRSVRAPSVYSFVGSGVPSHGQADAGLNNCDGAASASSVPARSRVSTRGLPLRAKGPSSSASLVTPSVHTQ